MTNIHNGGFHAVCVIVRLIGLAGVSCTTHHSVNLEDVYLQCDDIADTPLLNQSIQLFNGSQLFYHLYMVDGGISWCQSYRECDRMDKKLVALSDPEIQSKIIDFSNTPFPAKAWVSGTRKNHGNGWTWVNEELDDCGYISSSFNCSDKPEDKKEYGALQDVSSTSTLDVFTTDGAGTLYNVLCMEEDYIDPHSWTSSQLKCFDNGKNRLATLAEASHARGTSQSFNLGLQYRPWIWFYNDSTKPEPIIFSSWNGSRKLAGDADCLTVEMGQEFQGSWTEMNCSNPLNYFICEDLPAEPPTTGPPTDPDSMTSTTTQDSYASATTDPGEHITTGSGSTGSSTYKGSGCGTGCIAGIVCGVLVAGVIIGVIVYFCCCKKDAETCCKKGATPVTTSSGQSNPAGPKNYIDVPNEGVAQVNPYVIADVSKLEGGQSEAAAYRPSSAQYAEVGGVSLQIDSKKAPANTVAPSEYSLARPISEGPTGGPATYGEVKKRDDDDEVILVDNQNYGAYNPAVDGKIPSGAARAKQLPPIGQDKGSNKPAPATKPPKPPKNAKPPIEPKEV